MKKTVKTILSVALAVVIAFSGIGSVEARAAKKNDFSKEINIWLVSGLDGLPLFGITPYDFVSDNAPKKRVTKIVSKNLTRPEVEEYYYYKYDKAGRIKKSYYSGDGDNSYDIFYYDDEDNMIEEKCILNGTEQVIRTFTTDKKGRVIKSHSDNITGYITDATYTYKGNRLKKMHMEHNMSGYSAIEHRYIYDSSNRFIGFKCVDMGTGESRWKDTFKYDEEGRICSAKTVKANSNSNHSYTFSYDKDGYLLKIQRDDEAERCLHYETVK